MAPFLKNYPLSIRLLALFCLLAFNYILLGIIAVLCLNLFWGADVAEAIDGSTGNAMSNFNAVMFLQAVLSIGIFILTPIEFSDFEAGNFKSHLRLKQLPSLRLALLGVFAILVAQFFIPLLVDINDKIPLPEALMYLKESKTEGMEKLMTNFTQPYQFALATLVMAIIPAIGEEMLFRGLLLGDLLKAKIPVVTSIVVTGFLFALVHLQFKNVIAIWALGSFLGYLYYVSGSLWLPIAVHFTNNFLTVLLKYLYNNHTISIDVETATPPLYMAAISLMVFAGCVALLHKWKVQPFYHQSDYFSGGQEI